MQMNLKTMTTAQLKKLLGEVQDAIAEKAKASEARRFVELPDGRVLDLREGTAAGEQQAAEREVREAASIFTRLTGNAEAGKAAAARRF